MTCAFSAHMASPPVRKKGLVVGFVVLLVFSTWPETHLQAAQDDLCILCTHGVSTRAKKSDLGFEITGKLILKANIALKLDCEGKFPFPSQLKSLRRRLLQTGTLWEGLALFSSHT